MEQFLGPSSSRFGPKEKEIPCHPTSERYFTEKWLYAIKSGRFGLTQRERCLAFSG